MTPEQFTKFRLKHLGTRKEAAEILGYLKKGKPNQETIRRYEIGFTPVTGVLSWGIKNFLENIKLKKIIDKLQK